MTLITGVAYPLAVTGVAQVAFPHRANGSLIMKDGKIYKDPADYAAPARRLAAE